MRKIPFSPPDITELEINEVAEALRSGWITTGPRTKEFERVLAEYMHAPKCVCLNSATACEEMNLRILGVGEGDEVIVPAYTYTATASAALHTGASIKIADIQENCPEMDYDRLADAITEKTKAIIPVDYAGVVCDYDKLFEIAESKKSSFRPKTKIQEAIGRVAIVADCAHSLGATRNGKIAGEIADFSSFSFHAVKNLTTAEGGASVWKKLDGIDDEEIYRQYQLYSLHGQSKDALAKTKLGAWEYDILGAWYKCNMTDVMAAIGLKQFERYPKLIERRFEIIAQYDKAMNELGIDYRHHSGKNFKGSGHLYITRVPGASLERRNEIITKMAEQGVAANVHYKPLPMLTAYKRLGFDARDYPNAVAYFTNEISLPLHTLLTDEDVQYVIEAYAKALEETK